MGEGDVLSVQYIKVESIPKAIRIEKGWTGKGHIKKVIKEGSVIVENKPTACAAQDLLEGLSRLKVDFSSLEDGDIPKRSESK